MIRPDEPVMVCSSCGRGFLVNPGSKVDPVPVWFSSSAQSGPACNGLIRMHDRHALTRKLDLLEKIDGKTSAED